MSDERMSESQPWRETGKRRGRHKAGERIDRENRKAMPMRQKILQRQKFTETEG